VSNNAQQVDWGTGGCCCFLLLLHCGPTRPNYCKIDYEIQHRIGWVTELVVKTLCQLSQRSSTTESQRVSNAWWCAGGCVVVYFGWMVHWERLFRSPLGRPKP
jgi:hypothetical protein